MIKKCSNCYWCQEKQTESPDGKGSFNLGRHIGCYTGGKWRKWIPKKAADIPNECPNWKEGPIEAKTKD